MRADNSRPGLERFRPKWQTVADSELISNFEKLLPGFNRRQLSFEEMLSVAERKNFMVIIKPMRRAHGLAFAINEQPFLYLNKRLRQRRNGVILMRFAIAHELCHLVHHIRPFQGGPINKPKWEYEANTVAAFALMPQCEVDGLSINQIRQKFGVSRSIARFRFWLQDHRQQSLKVIRAA